MLIVGKRPATNCSSQSQSRTRTSIHPWWPHLQSHHFLLFYWTLVVICLYKWPVLLKKHQQKKCWRIPLSSLDIPYNNYKPLAKQGVCNQGQRSWLNTALQQDERRWSVCLQQWLPIHSQNIPVYAFIPKRTIFLHNCLHGYTYSHVCIRPMTTLSKPGGVKVFQNV